MKWLENPRSALPILKVIGCLLLAWFLLSPRVSPWLYSRRLFLPGHQRGSAQALAEYRKYPNKQVDFTAKDGSRLRGWFFENPSTDFVYLLNPGNSGDIPRYLQVADILLESGASVFIYEPRGFGESGGKPTMAHWLEDAESAYDVLTGSLGFTADRVILFGVSLGATAATHVMTVRPARAIVLQSAFSSLETIAKENVKILRVYPSFLFPNHKMNNVTPFLKPHPRLLVVHGLKDNLIPPSHARTIFGAALNSKEALFLPDSDHTKVDLKDRDNYVAALKKFLDSL